MHAFIARFARDTTGATAIEYALIAGLIFLVIISGVTLFAEAADEMFQGIADTMASVL